MFKCNILVGRFQPLTEGHIKCVEYAKTKKGVDTVLCMIDTPESKTNKKHPFPTNIMKSYIEESGWQDADIFNHPLIIKSADIVKIKEMIKEYGEHYYGDSDFRIVSWTCGTDRYADYKRMCAKYAPEIELIEIKRGDEDISATKAREALAADDYQTWKSIVPKHLGRRLWFDDLKSILSKVTESSKSLIDYIRESLSTR